MWKKRITEEEEVYSKETEEEKEEQIEESLQEIYEDGSGGVADVKKFDIRKRRGPFFWAAAFFILLASAGIGGWFYYDYYSFNAPARNNFELSIEPSKDNVLAGEEVSLKIVYKNMEKVSVKNLELQAILPDNFTVLETYPAAGNTAAGSKSIRWTIGSLDSKRSGEVEVRGIAMAKAGDSIALYAEASYTPLNFSSQFKKTAAASLGVAGIGVDFNFDNFTSAVVGEENEFSVRFKKADESYIDGFSLSISPKYDDFELIPVKYENKDWLKTATATPLEWQISSMEPGESQFPVNFKITDKKADQDEFTIKAYGLTGSGKYEIYEKTFVFDVLKGDLTLNLIVNGSKNDQGVNLGDTLNYLISYSNKSETAFKDIVIMAAIEGGAVNWPTLKDENNGIRSGNTISWSKNEIPALESLAPDAEGTIEFSLSLKDSLGGASGQPGEIKSAARYSIASSASSKDNQSNTITNKLNSRIDFNEAVMYFNEDNIAVGSGPIPPKAGQTTTYKVRWSLGGNIHELADVRAESTLPGGVAFAGNASTNVGQITYDQSSGKVIWNIGRLPVIGESINAEFSISVTPGQPDANKIMVLSSGASVSGMDTETNTEIKSASKAKTTALEDDEIGQSDGLVRQ
jgi:hypothetical protein